MSRAARWSVVIVSSTLIVLIVGVTLLFLPALRSMLAAEVADGSRSYGIGAGAEMAVDGAAFSVRPDPGWSVRPDGNQNGLLLHAPDGKLRIRLAPASAEEAEAALAEIDAPVRTERLGNGADIRHASVGQQLAGSAVSSQGDESGRVLLIQAEVSEGEDPARYRAAIGGVLERIVFAAE